MNRIAFAASFAALFLLATAASVLASAPAAVQPLVPGNFWEYRGASSGGTHVETITGTRELLGRTVFVKTTTGGPDDGLRNFWQTAPDGGVLLAGYLLADGTGIAYDPPILMMMGSPQVGGGWGWNSSVYNLPDLTPTWPLVEGVMLDEDVVLTLPAGSFRAYGIALSVSPQQRASTAQNPAAGHTLDGHRLAAGSTATDWVSPWFYTPGIGEVQYSASETFQLSNWGNDPTPAVTRSWGALKARYR